MLPEWVHQLGFMAWPLAACAVLAIAICIERAVFSIKSHIGYPKQYQQLSDYLLTHQSQPKYIRDEMVGIILSELQTKYYRGLKLLRVIGTMSPMLGLLGTILGIISAFKAIAAQSGPVLPSMIADGLWEAMLTTAVGLIIALPILVFAHLYRHLSEKQLNSMCLQLNKLSMQLELEKAANHSGLDGLNVQKLFA